MKKELKLLERLSIINMLPKQGSVVDMKTSDALEKKLNPTAKESEDLQIKQNGDQIQWNPDADKPVEISFTADECGLVAKKLKELDRVGKFTREMINLWEMFC